MRPDRSPSPRPQQITRQVMAGTPLRRPSKLLASSLDKPGQRTLVMLTVGGLSYYSDQLVSDWEELAEDVQCNFCAIEVGDAAESDSGLADLLLQHVPQGAAVYVVQRDSDVSGDEVKQLQQVLAKLNIPLASDEPSPLVANDQSAWTFEPEILAASSNPAFGAQSPSSFQQADPSLGRKPGLEHRLLPTASSIQQRLDEIARKRKERRIETFKLHCVMHAQMTLVDSLGAQLLQRQIDAGIDPTESGPAMSQHLIKAFNELQFTTHWQATASTPEAKVLRHLLANVCRMDEDTQSRVESHLLILLCHMRDDPALCRSVLSAASELRVDHDGVMAISRLCMARMEHRIASGAVDDLPLVAIDLARCVQRSRLLEAIYLRERDAMDESAHYHPRLRAEICIAFDQALMAVALHGGKEEMSFDEGTDPIAIATVQSAFQEMKRLGNERFNDFLQGWAPWQAFATRRLTQQAAQREPQSSTKD